MLQWNHPLRALCQYSVTLLRWPTSLAPLTGRGVCIIEFGLGFHAVTKKNNQKKKRGNIWHKGEPIVRIMINRTKKLVFLSDCTVLEIKGIFIRSFFKFTCVQRASPVWMWLLELDLMWPLVVLAGWPD